MRKMILPLLLCAALLCACGTVVPPAETIPSAAGEPAGEETPVPEETPDPAAQEQLSALLEELRQNVTIATAGSSLRSVAMAAKLLDWAEQAKISDEQIRSALEPWLAGPEDEIPAEFLEQLGAVDGMFTRLTGDSAHEMEGLLSDAGCENCGYPWSAEATATVERIMALAGLRETDAP